MKVCFLSMEYPPYPSYISPGGVGIHTYYLTKALSKLGHEIHVISAGCAEYDEINADGVTIHWIKSLSSSFLRLPIYSLKASIKLRQLYKFINFDIVHNESPYGFFESFLQYFNKKKSLVTTIHAVPIREMGHYEQVNFSLKNIKQTLSLLILRFLFNKSEYNNSQKLITVSDSTRRDLVDFHKISNKKIRVIYNGVDSESFNPKVNGQMLRSFFELGDSPVILYVGRLERNKGVYLLLKAAKKLIENKINAVFVIVGAGQHQIEMCEIGKRLGSQVKFIGRVSHKSLPFYYAMSDIIVVPSLCEGGPPLTLLEGMASGKPVITTDVSPINELIDNDCSIMISPNDVKQLIEKILTLLTNSTVRFEIGKKARQKILECFAWDKVAKQTEKVYAEVLNSNK